MDNFFSNPALFESLLAEGIYCSGTVRINRRGMPEAIKGVKLKGVVVVQTSSRQFIKNWMNVTKFVMTWLSSWWILGSIIHMKVL
jgi:hypothetical protein